MKLRRRVTVGVGSTFVVAGCLSRTGRAGYKKLSLKHYYTSLDSKVGGMIEFPALYHRVSCFVVSARDVDYKKTGGTLTPGCAGGLKVQNLIRLFYDFVQIVHPTNGAAF